MDLRHHRQHTARARVGVANTSITHISHSGLSRSSGAVAVCPQTSANSRRPSGDNKPMEQMTIEVERIVLDPPG